MKKSKWLRYSMFIVGIIILTFGARMILLSEIGVGGLDAIAIGLSEHFDISIGTCIVGLGVLLIILGSSINKRIRILPLGTSFVVGWFYDLWGRVLFDHIQTSFGEVACGLLFLGGILIAPLGAAIYIISNVSTGPVDYLMLALRDHTRLSMQNSRILIETVFVICGCLVGGPVGRGTICIMLFWGPILQIYYQILVSIRERYKSRKRK